MAGRAQWPTAPRTVFFADAASRTTIASATKAGRIRRLAVGVWTADLTSSPAEIVAANLWEIVSRSCPDAVLVDRTAAKAGRVDRGVVTVATDARRSPLTLPGVEVLVRPHEEHPSDLPWSNALRLSSPARTLVDNLAATRRTGDKPGRTLTHAELQDWLAERHQNLDLERFNRLCSDARRYAAERHPDRVRALDAITDEVTGRAPLPAKSGPYVLAAKDGNAWDPRRVALFEKIAATLDVTDPELPAGTDGELPFFEAYFSNYIEGTEFEVAVARSIIATQEPPPERPADGHDLLGTYRCVVDPLGRALTSDDPSTLIDYLKTRHRTLMVGRSDLHPSTYKARSNRVGSVEFVEPHLVHGTLLKGFSYLERLPPGLPRAIFAMFVVTETHPFTDGNGRVARMAMNAELSAVGRCRIVIPTILRNEYIASLRLLTTDGDISALTRVLTHALRWTALMPWDDETAIDGQLTATNATLDSADASNRGVHLLLP